MKRIHCRAALLFLPVFLLFLCSAASANSWGLTGALYQAVEQSRAWDDYSTLSRQAGPFAVMHSRYHNALFYFGEDEQLHVYTAAVYQPDTKKKAPSLDWDGQVLTLRYGEDESYAFCAAGPGNELQLMEMHFHAFHMASLPGENGYACHYLAQEDGSESTAVFPEKILLSGFNILLFPHSLDEVRHLNYMRARFDSGLNVLGTSFSGDAYDPDHPGDILQPGKKGTAPVYSAPFGKSAWRAGKGKAAVGLNGSMEILSEFRNADGDSYACIRYNVSGRTQRIGYALCRDLGLPEVREQSTEPGCSFVHIDVCASADTFLTDDPDVSQFQQFTVPKGTQFDCLGFYNDSYAYAAAEVKGGKFTDGGAVVWGFVPIRDLVPMQQETCTEIMQRLTGTWMLDAGGEFTDPILTFQPDGTFTTGNGAVSEGEGPVLDGAQSGTYYVTEYSPFMNLYWNQPPYELTMLYDNGCADVHGLDFNDSGFSLTFWEGGAGYVPFDGSLDLSDDHG